MSWEQLGISNYPEYFKTDWWFDLNWKLIHGNRDARCWICNITSKLLLHHVSYKNLGKEKYLSDVYILCFDCHNQAHFWTIFKIKIPLTTNWLLFSMRLRKMLFCIQNRQFGLFLLWFSIIVILAPINITKVLLKYFFVGIGKLLWRFVVKKTLYSLGIDIR